MIHEVAAEGFERGADAYERARPSYPSEAVDHVVARLGISAASRVADLGAGTGKFTRLLVPTGASIVAVEPVAAMRAQLATAVPGVDVVDGTAEAIPLDDGSVDAVVVAQAFHWFDLEAALAEIARVLRPGGGLCMLWNRRDESTPWVRRMSEVIDWHAQKASSYERTDWPAAVAASGRFAPLDSATFRYDHEVDRALLADRVRSVSYLARMSPADQDRIVGEVLALVDGFDEPFALPYVTHVHCTTSS